CTLGLSGNDHIPGFKAFTYNTRTQAPFRAEKLSRTPTWVTGPTVSKGTMPNGVMIFDTADFTIHAIPLGSDLHTLPSSI
ncbi:hypothetical protein, partial [Pseudomonas viridiflava]